MKSFISFLIGAGLGAGSAYAVLKNKFEKKINQELLADIQHKKDKQTENSNLQELPVETEKNIEEKKMEKKPASKKAKKEDVVVAAKEPYEITEDEYDNGTFPHVSLIYHMPSDVLTEYRRNENPDEVIVNNPSELIGMDVLSQFQNSTDDFLYVRNESKGVDYEIMASAKTFRKTKKAAPDKEE